ncbi:MAG: GNAT family N-acetyltransferase [Acidobacteria bacterium]|nr:GNAT family N-acetyltransferase [Acidobacteriota bacterium]
MRTFKTKRLTLRKYREEDREQFFALFMDEAVMKRVGDGTVSLAKAESIFSRIMKDTDGEKRIMLAICEKSNFIGNAGIYTRSPKTVDREIGFVLKRSSWGRGYATEVGSELIRIGFEILELPVLYATVDCDHFASINVLKKIGMVFDEYEFDDQGKYSRFVVFKRRAQDL